MWTSRPTRSPSPSSSGSSAHTASGCPPSRGPPLIAGAVETVTAVAERHRLGLASSANRRVIDVVLELAGLDRLFEATVSSEEVPRGKPAPDVYLEAARRLGVAPEQCGAVEDSANGIRSAAAAGITVVAIPNRDFPPDAEALGLAAAVLPSLSDLPNYSF